MAVAVGSRGIHRLHEVVSLVVGELRRVGAVPFIVPAMGSHGGATSDGQMALLAGYGVTPETTGVEFSPSMEVEYLGAAELGGEVVFSRAALEAEKIVLINRVKPHTDFSGSIGSGLLKMLVVGLGKRIGATNYHLAASRYGYAEVLRSFARVLRVRTPLLCGLAILENQRHQAARIAVVEPDDMEATEAILCAEARALMPRLPMDDLDLLIVDQIGKNISGTGMDPAMIGRSIHGYSLADPDRQPAPRVRRLFVRDLTPQTKGNAIGIGMADFTTERLAASIDWQVTALNTLTALSLQGAKLPLRFGLDREAIATALASLGIDDSRRARIARIQDTLSLEHLLVSEESYHQLRGREDLELPGALDTPGWDVTGNLTPWR